MAMKGAIGAVIAVIVLVALIQSGHHHKSNPAAAKAAAPKFELIASKSSCQEQRDQASLNCSIAVKNLGATDGLPTVYGLYFYNDGGTSSDQSDNGLCRASDPVPAGQIGYVYFCHTYNALQHDMIRAAASLNLGAKTYPYVRVVQPGVPWP